MHSQVLCKDDFRATDTNYVVLNVTQQKSWNEL